MSTVKKSRDEFEKREGHLSKFNQEKAALAQTIEALKKDRSAAVRALASGDSSQRKIILKLESEIKEKTDFLEGQEIHIAEAEASEQTAREALKEAEAEHEARFRDFINEENAAQGEEILKSLEARYATIRQTYLNLREQTGEISILRQIFEERHDNAEKIIRKFLEDLVRRLRADDAKEETWGLDYTWCGEIISTPCGSALDRPPYPRFVRSWAEHREARRRDELRKKFEETGE